MRLLVILPFVIVVEHVKRDFSEGCFQNAFIEVNYSMALDGDAEKAMCVLTEAHFEGLKADIRAENKTTIRKHMKTWETNIDNILKVNPTDSLVSGISILTDIRKMIASNLENSVIK